MSFAFRLKSSAGPRAPGAGVALAAAVAGSLVLLALAVAGDTVATVWRLHEPLPFYDEWESLALYRALVTGAAPWTALFSQHNEHRIVFPRLILFADYRLFQGRGYLDLAAIVAIQATHAALLSGLARRAGVGTAGALALAALVVVMLFGFRQEENFSWGFQVQFVGVFAAATAAFCLFARALGRRRDGLPAAAAFAGAFALAAVATFSMANGILSAFVLIALAVVARAGRRVTAAAAAVAAALAFAYVHGFASAPDASPVRVLLTRPGAVLHFAAAYLGGLFDGDLPSATFLGAWGLAAAAAAAWRMGGGRDRDGPRLALFGVVLFTAASAGLTALGRVPFGVDGAFAGRYATGAGVFWSALLIFWWSAAANDADGPRRLRPAVARALVALTAAVLLGAAWRAQSDDKAGAEQRAFALAGNADAFLLGLVDATQLDKVTAQDAPGARSLVSFMRDRTLSVFAGAPARRLGRSLAEAGTIVGHDACAGGFGTAASDPGLGPAGTRVAGAAVEGRRRRPVRRVLVADAGGTVVGLASAGPPDEPPGEWRGFATAPPGATLRAYAVLKDGGLCDLGARVVAGAGAS